MGLALPAPLIAYRETSHSTMGYNSFQLLYGRDVRGLLKEAWVSDEQPRRQVTKYLQGLRELSER